MCRLKLSSHTRPPPPELIRKPKGNEKKCFGKEDGARVKAGRAALVLLSVSSSQSENLGHRPPLLFSAPAVQIAADLHVYESKASQQRARRHSEHHLLGPGSARYHRHGDVLNKERGRLS